MFDASLATLPEHRKPIFSYLGLLILQHVSPEDRMTFFQAFGQMVAEPKNIALCRNAYLSEQISWQTGIRVPVLRVHGLHTNTTWMAKRLHEVLVSRPGTSGGWQECLYRFVDANPVYPLRFVQFTNLIDARSTVEVYNSSVRYAELAERRAVVMFPYHTSLMLFWEFYSMGIPTFVPFQLWRWASGQHARPDLRHGWSPIRRKILRVTMRSPLSSIRSPLCMWSARCIGPGSPIGPCSHTCGTSPRFLILWLRCWR